MATDWDKLQKLKRDHPKAKFASKEISRQRKKQPTNPYLLAWQADVSLELGISASSVISNTLFPVLEFCPPITDTRLLVYVYKTFANALRKEASGYPNLATTGPIVLKAWETAAKTLPSRKARLDFWSALFTSALREDCWEDVRWTLTQALKEGVKSKKNIEFTLILANQMVYSREMENYENTEPPNQKSRIQMMVAYQKMKQAFQNANKPEDDSVKVNTMRDLRFMAQIFRLQKRHAELNTLWAKPPAALADKLEQNIVEVELLLLDSIRDDGLWNDTYNVAIMCLTAAVEKADGPNSQYAILVKSWKLWRILLEAEQLRKVEPKKKAEDQEVLFNLYQKIAFEGREIELTGLAVALQLKPSHLLEMCRKYWRSHCQLNSCFQDLRRYIESMSREEQREFHQFISESAISSKPDPENSSFNVLRSWLQIELNVIKFDYLLAVARRDSLKQDSVSSSTELLEAFVGNAIRLYTIGFELKDDCYQEAAILAVQGLIVLHCQSIENGKPTKTDPDHRLLLQAAFLSLHATAGETGIQNRPLLLISARLHLYLGLATIAFAQYSLVRVKEMLQDTLSHYFMSRISQIHPFDAKGPKQFSPDDELSKVVSTIKRMESRVDDFLYANMQDFLYDQAIELSHFKRQLKGSLSKHLCVIERRRIARFKGVPVDSTYDLPLEDYYFITDNRDHKAIPQFESVLGEDNSTLVNLHDNAHPNIPWLYERHELEDACRLVFNETTDKSTQARLRSCLKETRTTATLSPMEHELSHPWRTLHLIAHEFHAEFPVPTAHTPDRFMFLTEWLLEHVRMIHLCHAPEKSKHEPVDDWILPGVSAIKLLYGILEVVQAAWRLCESVKEILKKSNNKWKHKLQVKTVELCAVAAQDCHLGIIELADSWINALKSRGVQNISVQARWGPTGAALRQLINDSQQRQYAQDTVDSAVETLQGLKMVKLK